MEQKFRQWYHDAVASLHQPADMALFSTVTQSDWTPDPLSRDAYMTLSVIHKGVMEERLRLTAEGHMMLNTDTIVVDGPTGNTLIRAIMPRPAQRSLVLITLISLVLRRF